MDIQTEYQTNQTEEKKYQKKRKENGSWRNKNKSKINDIKKYKQTKKNILTNPSNKRNERKFVFFVCFDILLPFLCLGGKLHQQQQQQQKKKYTMDGKENVK